MTACRRIFIVDDELIIRMQLESMLAKEKYDITLLASGKELLAQLEKGDVPDLIVLDVMMPEVDGFEACRQIKANHQFQHVPIILITALDGKQVLAEGLNTGADDFLQKPVNKLELRARVRSMLRIKQQYEDLEAALKMREELSNMVVHDMSSPIVAVLLHATLMEEKISDPDLLEHLEMIRMSADRLDAFINDMLMLAKMEQSKLHLNRSPVMVNELVLEAEKHFSIMAHSKGIRLSAEVPEPALQMQLDSNLFQRIIANLLANALKYSPNNTEVKVKLTPLPSSDAQPHLKMQVFDEGPGIPDEFRSRIFKKFEVVELKNKGILQIGLGLTFCKMAVDAHGGKIYVTANKPQGSIFVVEI